MNPRWLLSASWIAASVSAVAAEPPNPDTVREATLSFQALNSAISDGRWADAEVLMHPMGLPADKVLVAQADTIRRWLRRQKLGIMEVHQRILDIEVYAEGKHRLAIFRVTRYFRHPMRPGSLLTSDDKVFALSEGNQDWKFLLFDCRVEAEVRRLFPAYAGKGR